MGRRRVLQADEDQDPNSEEYGFNLPLHIKISRATDWTKYLGPLNPEIIKQDPKGNPQTLLNSTRQLFFSREAL